MEWWSNGRHGNGSTATASRSTLAIGPFNTPIPPPEPVFLAERLVVHLLESVEVGVDELVEQAIPRVVVESYPWAVQGAAVGWLVSEVFGLKRFAPSIARAVENRNERNAGSRLIARPNAALPPRGRGTTKWVSPASGLGCPDHPHQEPPAGS